MNNETVTNVFWGFFIIWLGVVAVAFKGNLFATVNFVNDPIFALGAGLLLLLLNLTRSVMHLRLSVLTLGLGALLEVIFIPVIFFNFDIQFLPVLIIILGVALVIGAFRTRNLQI